MQAEAARADLEVARLAIVRSDWEAQLLVRELRSEGDERVAMASTTQTLRTVTLPTPLLTQDRASQL